MEDGDEAEAKEGEAGAVGELGSGASSGSRGGAEAGGGEEVLGPAARGATARRPWLAPGTRKEEDQRKVRKETG